MARKYSRKNKSNNTKKRTRLLNKKVYKVSTKKVRVNKKKRTIKKKIKGGANPPAEKKKAITFNIIPIEQGPTDEDIKNYIYKSDNATDITTDNNVHKIMKDYNKNYNEKLNKIKNKYDITIKLHNSLVENKNKLTDKDKDTILNEINKNELYADFKIKNNNNSSEIHTEKKNSNEIIKINNYNYAYNISEKNAVLKFLLRDKYNVVKQSGNYDKSVIIEDKIIKNSTKLKAEFRDYIKEKNRFYKYLFETEENNLNKKLENLSKTSYINKYKVKIVYEIDMLLSSSRNTTGKAKNFKLYIRSNYNTKEIFILPATKEDNEDALSNPYNETKLMNDIQELIDLEIIKLETNDNRVQIKEILKKLENDDEISEIIFKNLTEN